VDFLISKVVSLITDVVEEVDILLHSKGESLATASQIVPEAKEAALVEQLCELFHSRFASDYKSFQLQTP
jgi:hypothetical protein